MSGITAAEVLRSTLSTFVIFATNGYILAALALIYLLRNKYAQGLNAVPGPFLAGFSSLWRLVDVWGGSAQWTVIRLHRELGPLVRTGPRHLSVSDPKAINTIYGVNPRFLKVRSLTLSQHNAAGLTNLRNKDWLLSSAIDLMEQEARG